MMDMLSGFDWMSLLQMIGVPLGLMAAGFAVKWLQGVAALKSNALKNDKLQGTEYLKSSVMNSLMTVVANIAGKELKELKALAEDGKIDKEDLAKLKDHAIDTVKDEFKSQGRDIAKELGPRFMDEGLRFVVDKFNKDNPEESKKTKKKSVKKVVKKAVKKKKK